MFEGSKGFLASLDCLFNIISASFSSPPALLLLGHALSGPAKPFTILAIFSLVIALVRCFVYPSEEVASKMETASAFR